jgi:phage-related protein
VRDWLLELDPADRRLVGFDIQTVEFGWPLGMPTCRSLGDGLWEVRTSGLSGQRIARVLFCIVAGEMVLLHGFIKKTQKTPQNEIETAHKRRKEFI